MPMAALLSIFLAADLQRQRHALSAVRDRGESRLIWITKLVVHLVVENLNSADRQTLSYLDWT